MVKGVAYMVFEHNLNNIVKTTCYYKCSRAVGSTFSARLIASNHGKITIKGDFEIYRRTKELALDLSNNPLGTYEKRLNEQNTESVYAIQTTPQVREKVRHIGTK
ncbi:hypothetical protein HZS_5598 [Henneguya salminicola]|nr:hypothetical protein HZS_5598 [Henneguya salminicola]